MNLRIIGSALLIGALMLSACGDDDAPSSSPTDGTPAVSGEVPGFEQDLAIGRSQNVVLGPLAEVTEPVEAGVKLNTTSTPEGEVPSEEFYAEVGPAFPLVTNTFRPAGNWIPTGVVDSEGDLVAVRLQSEAAASVDLPLFTFDAVLAAAGNARISGPSEPFEDISGSSGVRQFRPLEVLVRGTTGLYLQQELPDLEPRPPGTPICSLVWLEAGVYYRMAGICDSHETGRYNMFMLIQAASEIQAYDSN